jgi:hypothetical protein
MADNFPIAEIGATSIQVKRTGESIRMWFVTEDGREISLCDRGLTEGMQIEIALDPANVRLKTGHFEPTHRHADGGVYQALAPTKIKEPSGEWVPGVLYRNSEGMLFVRRTADFEGRFVAQRNG